MQISGFVFVGWVFSSLVFRMLDQCGGYVVASTVGKMAERNGGDLSGKAEVNFGNDQKGIMSQNSYFNKPNFYYFNS